MMLRMLTEVFVHIHPRVEASPDALRELGDCIRRWVADAPGEEFEVSFDPREIEDLLAGELPSPRVLLISNNFKDAARIFPDNEDMAELAERSLGELLEDGGPSLRDRTVRLIVAQAIHRLRDLHTSLCASLHAPAVSKFELTVWRVDGLDTYKVENLVHHMD